MVNERPSSGNTAGGVRDRMVGGAFVVLTVFAAAGCDSKAVSKANGSTQAAAQSSAPAGWSTYRGAGYTFAYPSDWQVSTSNAAGQALPDVIAKHPLGGNFFCYAELQPQQNFIGDFLEKVDAIRSAAEGAHHKTITDDRVAWPNTKQAEYYVALDDRVPAAPAGSAASTSPSGVSVRTVELAVLSKSNLSVDLAVSAPDLQSSQCDLATVVHTLHVQ